MNKLSSEGKFYLTVPKSNSYEEAKLLFDGALRLLIELGLSSEQDPSLLLCRAEFTQDVSNLVSAPLFFQI